MTALELFVSQNNEQNNEAIWEDWHEKADYMVEKLGGVEGTKVCLDENPTTQEGPVAVLHITPPWHRIPSRDVTARLMEGDHQF